MDSQAKVQPKPLNALSARKEHMLLHVKGSKGKWFLYILEYGKPTATKTDEFSEKFQTVFNPPPSFSENDIADFLGTRQRLRVLVQFYYQIYPQYE